MTPRLGAIDVGTNTVLLTIAASDGARLAPLVERATITRLGQGVDERGELHPDACARTLACLRDYRALCDALCVTQLHAVGTSALRDARDGAAFREKAREILGVELEIIPGQREAALTFRGGLSGIDLVQAAPSASPAALESAPLLGPRATDASPAARPIFVFDIGGGSTELIWGHVDPPNAHGPSSARWTRAESLDLGSVRLFERFRMTDPPLAPELAALDAFIDAALARVAPTADASTSATSTAPLVIGVAGTVTTLVALIEETRATLSSGPGPAHPPRPKEPLSRSSSPSFDIVTSSRTARDSLSNSSDTHARDSHSSSLDTHARDSNPNSPNAHARDSNPNSLDTHARDSHSNSLDTHARDSHSNSLDTHARDSHSSSSDAHARASLVDASTTISDALRSNDALPAAELERAAERGALELLAPVASSVTPPFDHAPSTAGASVHGHMATLEELRTLTAQLASLSTAERCQLPGLDPGRADVIVIGAILCVRLLEWIGADFVVASDRGVRWGLLEEAQESIDSRQTSD